VRFSLGSSLHSYDLPVKIRTTWLVCAVWALGAMGLARAAAAYAVEAPPAHQESREQATREVQKRYGGEARVVRTDVVEQNGHQIYVFRLLSGNGRVWIVRIDATSGAEVP
jgi:Peptidase propeptide and YPEB domain